jgi:hypothetical protein
MKRIALMTMIVLLAGALFVTDSNAAVVWYTVEVIAAGPMETGGVYVRLVDTASPQGFAEQWFSVPPNIGKEVLAVALTAVTTGTQVMIAAEMSTSPPTILRFYILP